MTSFRKAILCLTFVPTALTAAGISYTGVTGGEWVTDSNWSSSSYPTSGDHALLDTTVHLSVPHPNNIRAIRVGTAGTGTLHIASQATLHVSSHAAWDSHIGNSNGNEGSVNQEGGSVEINELEIGRNSSTGSYYLHDGNCTIVRGLQGNSLYLGTDDGKGTSGTGTFSIYSGEFKTRFGVYLGSTSGGIGNFEVIGSHADLIGIGSHGTGDGLWTQNTGSTLRARIDKTPQGITPIFIDDEGNNGGGDVIFENGALLDVDFTSTFVNGGTFTVMEWEGTVTDNGLQFAPSVDTNIWSFQVDVSNKRLTVTAVGSQLVRNFVHPGLSHKLSDLERMRDMVAAGIDPWATTFSQLSSHPRAQHTYSSTDSPSYTILGDSGTNNSNAFLVNDGYAAYYNALMWMMTGDSRHAEASIRVFNNWSGLVGNETSIPLDSGRHWRLIEAAEIIKSTYSGWSPTDLQAFKDMLVYPGYSSTTAPTTAINNEDITFYWRCYQGDPIRHGNQGLFCMRMVLAMGVFLDNEIMYDRALRYLQGAPARSDDLSYPSGVPNTSGPQGSSNAYYDEYSRNGDDGTVADYGYNAVMHNLIWPNGQGQESSRDQAHTLTGPGILATMSEIAWSQGDDLYGHLDNRLLLGFEHYYRYNLSYENSFPDQLTPWEPTVANGEFIQRLDRSGRWFSLQINPFLAGNIGPEFIERGQHNDQPLFEMNRAHYRDRMNVPAADTKWLDRGFDLYIQEFGVEQEGGLGDFSTRGSMAFRRVSPGDPIQGFTNGAPDFAMHTFPGTVEAENYDYFPVDGEGTTYHDSSSTNSELSYRPAEGVDLSSASEGNFAISSIEANEWVTYTVSVPTTTDYELSIRYASTAPGGTIQFSFDGTDVTGNVAIPHGAPASSGASDWQSLIVATDVPLTHGVQQLTLTFGGTANAFLLNNFTIEEPAVLPIAHWRFDEGGSNIAADCSGNGHHGTINNATWTTRTGGGNALSFNGTNANVSLPTSAFSSLNNEVSFAFWAFGDSSLPTTNSAFWAGNSGGGRILNVHLPWDNSQVYFDANDRINKTATVAETEGSWAHWAFTKDANAGTMKIFRNGTLWHSGTGKTNSIGTIAQAFIGSQNNIRYYPGLIDDFRLYDVALSNTAIANLYTTSLNTTPEDHLWQGGESLTVNMTSPTGTAGTDWDLLNISCPLVLDNSLTAGNPFQINLTAPAIGFDNTTDQSWLIVTASEVLGSYQASDFVVNSSAFAANNSLDGGTFEVSRIGNNFLLNFTARELTAIENWRLANFGTSTNTGTAADTFDADSDGIANLLEYATGLNPNEPSELCASEIAPAANGNGLVFIFDRIADPNLTYTVQGTNDLEAVNWPTIWTGTGTAAGTVTIPEALWPSNEPFYFLRLAVSY